MGLWSPHNSQMLPSSYSYQLAQRTFHTFDFYKKHQDAMTPAGLAFFQCRWDDSVTHIFHQLLGIFGLFFWQENCSLFCEFLTISRFILRLKSLEEISCVLSNFL